MHNHSVLAVGCTPSCPMHPLYGEEGPTSIEELLEERAHLLARIGELEAQIDGLRAVGAS